MEFDGISMFFASVASGFFKASGLTFVSRGSWDLKSIGLVASDCCGS